MRCHRGRLIVGAGERAARLVLPAVQTALGAGRVVRDLESRGDAHSAPSTEITAIRACSFAASYRAHAMMRPASAFFRAASSSRYDSSFSAASAALVAEWGLPVIGF